MTIEAIATFIPPILAAVASVLAIIATRLARIQSRIAREAEARAKKELIETRIQTTFMEFSDSLEAARDVLVLLAKLPEEQQTEQLRSAALYIVDRSNEILTEFEDIAPPRLKQLIDIRMQMLREIRVWIQRGSSVNEHGRTASQANWLAVQRKLDTLRNRELLNMLDVESSDQVNRQSIDQDDSSD